MTATRTRPAGWLACAGLAGLFACSGRSSAPAGSRVGPATVAAPATVAQVPEPLRCAAPDGPSDGPPDLPAMADEMLTVGTHRWQLAARVMKLDASDGVSIGVIADAAGNAPETLAALGRLRKRLGQVDLVISLGGMGASRAELEATFAVIADGAAWPLVALPGDLEPAAAQAEAIAVMRQRGAAVVDGRRVQRIELPAATIVLVPGAGAASRLVPGAGGCGYRAADAAAAFADLTPRAGLRILASAEAPRAVERGEPTGELALTAGAGQQIDIALHGPTAGTVTPARSGDRDGTAVSLTPGSSDATPRLPGPRRSPTAGILTLHGSAWRWWPVEDGK